LRPKLIFTALGGYTYPYMRKDEGDQTWKVELSAAVPIFDRNVTRSNVMKAEATRRQDKIALEQKELDIKSEVETAWTDIETTLRRLKASEKALELAKESLRLAEVGFREGVTPQLDLLDAQTSYTSARLDYLSAEYNHLLTIVALKVTEGTILDWAKGKNFK
ncbi:MAG: TolC family protein, partial [Synergistaceae bacterium]|nr:TolC family protein [Synergistaceae bacterium]